MFPLLHQRLFEEGEEADRLVVLQGSHHTVLLQLECYVPMRKDTNTLSIISALEMFCVVCSLSFSFAFRQLGYKEGESSGSLYLPFLNSASLSTHLRMSINETLHAERHLHVHVLLLMIHTMREAGTEATQSHESTDVDALFHAG